MPLAALKTDMGKIAGWMTALPAALVWPFASAFPIIALASKAGAYPAWPINAAFAATGMWGVLAVWFVVRAVLGTGPRAKFDQAWRGRGALITAYAYGWMAAYALVLFGKV